MFDVDKCVFVEAKLGILFFDEEKGILLISSMTEVVLVG